MTLQNKDEFEDALKYLNIAKILSLKDISIDYRIAKLHTKMKNFAKADLIYKGSLNNNACKLINYQMTIEIIRLLLLFSFFASLFLQIKNSSNNIKSVSISSFINSLLQTSNSPQYGC